jgi:hypothetical protein
MIAELMIAFATLCGFGAGYFAARHTCPHRWTLELEPHRIRLTCPLCGAYTEGWDLTLASPPRHVVVDVTDHRVH